MVEKYRFGDKLQELIDLLEKMTGDLMMNHMDDFKDTIPELSKLMEICFPAIIASYSDVRLKDVSSDARYWSDQLARIIDALNMDDKFAKIDVLYHETRANLITYHDMIQVTTLPDEMIEFENEA